MEDSQFLQLLSQDPNAAMEALIAQYAALVYAVVQGKLSGTVCLSSDIEDCVADVFSEFYMELDRFDPQKASIKTYLCVIARHNAADLLRKRKLRQGDISLDDENTPEMIFDSNMEQSLLRRRVFAEICRLGEPDKTILLDKFYFGHSSKVIAAKLSMSVSNVDTRTCRALQKLRDLIGGIKA